MAEKIKTAEIKISEIKISDGLKNWEFISELVGNTYTVNFVEAPGLHGIDGGIDIISVESSKESDREDKQVIFSQESAKIKEKLEKLSILEQEKENEENKEVKKEMDKSMWCESLQHERERENQNGSRNIDASMQDEPLCNKDSERVKREIEDALQLDRLEQENERLRKERDEALQIISKYVQENERIRSENEKKISENERKKNENERKRREIKIRENEWIKETERIRRETKMIKRAIEEVRKEIIRNVEVATDSSEYDTEDEIATLHDVTNERPIPDGQERNSESLTWHGQQPESIKCCAVNSQKESMNEICQEESKPNQNNKVTSNAAVSSKSESVVFKSETLVQEKGEIRIVDQEFMENLSKFFKKNPHVKDKDSTETAKVDKM